MKTLTLASSSIALLLGTGAALASFNVGDSLGTTEADIRAALEAKGAVVEEIETEDNLVEAEIVLDGVEMEIAVDLSSGAIAEIETDDDDDGDNEDDDDDSDN